MRFRLDKDRGFDKAISVWLCRAIDKTYGGLGVINHLSALELGGVAARGGSLEVDAASFSALDLGGIAARLTDGATLKICNSSAHLSAVDMGGIAARKPGQVIFA
jgi:hypothetical protein